MAWAPSESPGRGNSRSKARGSEQKKANGLGGARCACQRGPCPSASQLHIYKRIIIAVTDRLVFKVKRESKGEGECLTLCWDVIHGELLDAGPQKGHRSRRTEEGGCVPLTALGSCKARSLGLQPAELSLTSCQTTFSSKCRISPECPIK